jgi:hypothetical protein
VPSSSSHIKTTIARCCGYLGAPGDRASNASHPPWNKLGNGCIVRAWEGCSLKSRSDKFLENARECEERARGTRGPVTRAHFLDLARRWRALAAAAGELESSKGYGRLIAAAVRYGLLRAA